MIKTLVMGLGNEILADDAVGVLIARQLEKDLAGRADVISCALHGLSLLELFIGYERAILIDAIQSGKKPPGTITELRGEDLDKVYAPSPHYAGVPEMLELAEQLELEFPKEFRIFAIEVEDMRTIGGSVTASVAAAIPEVCRRVKAVVEGE